VLNNVTLIKKQNLALSDTTKYQEEQYKSLSESCKKFTDQYIELRDQQKVLFERIEKVTKNNNLLQKRSEFKTVTFKLPEYSTKKNKSVTFFSAPFFTHKCGYNICVNIDANGFDDGEGTHVSVLTKVLKGYYDDQLQLPFLGSVTFELLNQLGDDNHLQKVLVHDTSHDMEVSSSYGYPKFLSHFSLGHNPVTNAQYLLDDTLYFECQ